MFETTPIVKKMKLIITKRVKKKVKLIIKPKINEEDCPNCWINKVCPPIDEEKESMRNEIKRLKEEKSEMGYDIWYYKKNWEIQQKLRNEKALELADCEDQLIHHSVGLLNTQTETRSHCEKTVEILDEYSKQIPEQLYIMMMNQMMKIHKVSDSYMNYAGLN